MLNKVKALSTGEKNLVMILFSLFIYCCSLNAQKIYSDAPITISENGELMTNMIYVKFKPGDVIEIPSNDLKTNENLIPVKYPII